MATMTARLSIVYPDCFDERAEEEVALKGWLGNVLVQTEDGARFQMFFIDPVRLEQMLADAVQRGSPFVGEPNMVVLPEITPTAIHTAVTALTQQGFFQRLKPMS